MRAIQIHRYGGPEVVVQREVAVPSPQRGEVLIRVAYSGINFMDVHTREGKYKGSRTYPQSLPTTLGIEAAGEIVSLGEHVTDLRVGDRVGYCLHWGSYADYAIVPAWRVVPLPEELSFELAAGCMFHGLTAHYLAHDVGKLAPGVSCLVLAASGGIGRLLVQMGSRLGATVFAAVSTEEKADVARRCGAADAFLYGDGIFADLVRDQTGGRGVDVVFDPVGKPTLRASLQAAKKKGLVVNFGSVGGSVKDIDPIELGEAGSLFLTRPRLADHLEDSAAVQRRSRDVFEGVLDGSLAIEIAGIYDFTEAQQAHDALEHRIMAGKPLLKVNAT